MVDNNGNIRTVAGTGKAGCSGYGGPITRAKITARFALCLTPTAAPMVYAAAVVIVPVEMFSARIRLAPPSAM